ncbi:erythroblast NAD(P)(+)--arginine ADP-ribosyltransferase-like [Elgaria multicarinata webbii]|uniref:erythroblast NAD(P)(+)--arginine ADP-ribosyltransferase-like n=1 Tax=Elgaria multicarinata webbii TaxID=159646 RepID=UPI002FCCF541
MTQLLVTLGLYLMAVLPGEHQIFCFSSETEELDFDMAPDSFDDQYEGCAEEMEARMKDLRPAEIDNITEYAEAWQKAVLKWKEMKGSISVPAGLKDDYAIALLAYTLETDLFKDFNKAVRKAASSKVAYLKTFHFKAMHFLLTRAVQVLHNNSKSRCSSVDCRVRDVFRGVRYIHFRAKRSSEARFGQFASSSLNWEIAQGFGTDTFFIIETCHGAFIDKFSFFPHEEEVLIPPFEKFRVDNFTEKPEGNTITLSSTGKYSVYNCVLVKGAGLSRFSATAQMPLLLWGFLLIAGAVGAPGLL